MNPGLTLFPFWGASALAPHEQIQPVAELSVQGKFLPFKSRNQIYWMRQATVRPFGKADFDSEHVGRHNNRQNIVCCFPRVRDAFGEDTRGKIKRPCLTPPYLSDGKAFRTTRVQRIPSR